MTDLADRSARMREWLGIDGPEPLEVQTSGQEPSDPTFTELAALRNQTERLVVSCRDLRALIDVLVEAVDLGRSEEVDRVRAALEPFGADRAFTDELRLNGTWSVDDVLLEVEF